MRWLADQTRKVNLAKCSLLAFNFRTLPIYSDKGLSLGSSFREQFGQTSAAYSWRERLLFRSQGKDKSPQNVRADFSHFFLRGVSTPTNVVWVTLCVTSSPTRNLEDSRKFFGDSLTKMSTFAFFPAMFQNHVILPWKILPTTGNWSPDSQ